ncbi:hypothetical protein HDV00_011336 [Rhizophlyctis rosea]|nr:hypothetical protein HDV00_011336 [Rhizophlyctis rosea]
MLARENDALGKAQAKFTHDKQDIVEFLNIKVGEHEKQINVLEETVRRLEQEKRDAEQRGKDNLDNAMKEAKKEMDGVMQQFGKAKAELADLKKFAEDKVRMEKELDDLKKELKAKERDYKETIYNLERKVLHDKNQMKKEMLSKVNEAVASFRRVADQQMAETTKRAIRENMAITSQLKKMSQKTIDIIAENDALKDQVAKLRTNNGLLQTGEQELAKKNQANQRVIKMLVEKLKESDKMLELAYESGAFDQDGNPILHTEEDEAQHEADVAQLEAYETEIQDMQVDIEDLQSLNEQYSTRLAGVSTVVEEMERFLYDVVYKGGTTRVGSEEVAGRWREYLARLEGVGELMLMPILVFVGGFRLQELRLPMSERQSQTGETPESDAEVTEENDPQQSSHPSPLPTTKDPLPPPPQHRRTSGTWRRKPADISPIIAAIPRSRKHRSTEEESSWIDPMQTHDIGVQTLPMPFGQHVDSQYLLGEVRPWGPPAVCLPKKGIGLYLARPMLPPTTATAAVTAVDGDGGGVPGGVPSMARGAPLRS